MGIGWIGRSRLEPSHRDVTCLDNSLERLALVFDVALYGLHQIGNQIVAACELHVDLRERVLYAVAQGDQPVVQADNTMLYQVLYNLLSNAVKYSSKKENPVIEIFAEQKNDKTVFTVKDNGAGFDMRFADKLFGVFQRLHSEKQFEGNGVGLAIVQRIITKFGGQVWAAAKENEGATFYFTLN